MDIADIEQLVDIVQNAKISELIVTSGSPANTIKIRKPMVDAGESRRKRTAASAPKPAVAVAQPSQDESSHAIYVKAPMVGIYHNTSGISEVGTGVKAGQVLGAIESMKLMNDVICEHDGEISEILAEDGMPVEYGHKLFKLNRN